MERQLVTRSVLARALALNAATRPLNVAVATGVAVAAVMLGTLWLLPVAVLVYLAMAVSTFFDSDETQTVSRTVYERARPGLPPPPVDLSHFEPSLARHLESARDLESRIRRATQAAPLAADGLNEDVTRLTTGLESLARRAQQIHDYLSEQDADALRSRLQTLQDSESADQTVSRANQELSAALEDQLEAIVQLQRQLSRLDAQMEQATASLGAILGHIVRMSAAEDSATESDVAGEVGSLRRTVNVTADAMRDTYEELSKRR